MADAEGILEARGADEMAPEARGGKGKYIKGASAMDWGMRYPPLPPDRRGRQVPVFTHRPRLLPGPHPLPGTSGRDHPGAAALCRRAFCHPGRVALGHQPGHRHPGDPAGLGRPLGGGAGPGRRDPHHLGGGDAPAQRGRGGAVGLRGHRVRDPDHREPGRAGQHVRGLTGFRSWP